MKYNLPLRVILKKGTYFEIEKYNEAHDKFAGRIIDEYSKDVDRNITKSFI